jgi:flagellar hook-length control protein FliK
LRTGWVRPFIHIIWPIWHPTCKKKLDFYDSRIFSGITGRRKMTDIQATAQPLAKAGQTGSLGSPAEAANSAAFKGLFAVLDMIGAEGAGQTDLAVRLAAAMGPAEQKDGSGLPPAEGPADAGSADAGPIDSGLAATGLAAAALPALSGGQDGDAGNQTGSPAAVSLPAALSAKTAQHPEEASAPLSDPALQAAIPRLSADILTRFSHDDLAHLQHQARRLLKDGQQASPNVKALVALLDEKLARAARKKTGEAAAQNSALTENQTAAAARNGLAPQNSPAAQPATRPPAQPETAQPETVQPAAQAARNLAANSQQPALPAGRGAVYPGGAQPNNQPAGAGPDAGSPRVTQTLSGHPSSYSHSGKTEQLAAAQRVSQAASTNGPTTGAPITGKSERQKSRGLQLALKASQPIAHGSRLPQRLPVEPAPTQARPADLMAADPLAAGRSAGAGLSHPVLSAAPGKQLNSAELAGHKKRASLNEAIKTDRTGLPSQTPSSAGSADRPGLDLLVARPARQAAETALAQTRAAHSQPAMSENTDQAEAAAEGGGAEDRGASRATGSQSGQPAGSANGGAVLQRLNMLAKGWQDNLVRQAEKALLEGRETVRLVLNPRHLGRLQLSLGLAGGEAHIQIQAESGAAAQLLGESEARLQQMLEAAGLRLASLNTGSGFGAGGHKSDQKSGQQREIENSSGRSAKADAEKNLTENLDKTDKEFLNILA